MIASIEGATCWPYLKLKRDRTHSERDRNVGFFDFIVWGDTSTLNTDPYFGCLRIETVENEVTENPSYVSDGIRQDMD
jgi:hypothetical protein